MENFIFCVVQPVFATHLMFLKTSENLCFFSGGIERDQCLELIYTILSRYFQQIYKISLCVGLVFTLLKSKPP